ncbi:Monooxygenase FAD-binding protein [Neofusicoccum parvum]|nr:Monooxygenase FAD-binding protein [Neofusicoccum parvum]
MASQLASDIVIIGGGLASLVLALSLHQRGIGCTIYEARPEDATTPGALMLSPNSLRILDTLGIYGELRAQGFNFSTVTFKNAAEETTDVYPMGDARVYGYDCLRVYRQTLLLALRAAARRAAIPIHYATKFSHVEPSADPANPLVTLALADGTTRTASLLVGADGIHSRLRTSAAVAPGSHARYGGRMAITFATSRARAGGIPRAYPLPVTIFGAPGAFVLAPQTPDGDAEMLAGTQIAFPEQDRAGWDRVAADKDGLLRALRAGAGVGEWPETAARALADVDRATLSVWPFYQVPPLERWYSAADGGVGAPGRVVVLGDAAHAIPPTAGQGASQAMEDAVTFAELVKTAEGPRWEWAVGEWQKYRQQRIDRVLHLTMQLNNNRLPNAEREKLADGAIWKSTGEGELAWLYSADVVHELGEWLKRA